MAKNIIWILLLVFLIGCSENLPEQDTTISINLNNEVKEIIGNEVKDQVGNETNQAGGEADLTSLKQVRILIGALNARSESNIESDVIGAVFLNQIYDVYQMDIYEDWYKIRLSSGDLAWVSAWYCSDIIYLEARDFKSNTLIVEIIEAHGLLYEDNNTSKVLNELPLEGRYEIVDTSIDDAGHKWYKIKFDPGVVGWVKEAICKAYIIK